MADEKDLQFNRMWNDESKPKREKFRNRMKAKLDILHIEFTEENARAYFHGRLRSRRPESLYARPERESQFRHRGRPSRGRRRPKS